MYRDRDFDLSLRLPSNEPILSRDLEANKALNATARDFDPQRKLSTNEQGLIQDLELNTLFNAMALGDKFLFEVAKTAVLSGLDNDLDTILYRQNILKDCLKNPAAIREMYDIAVESIENERKSYFSIFSRYTASVLHSAIDVLQMFVGALKRLRRIAEKNGNKFESEGFTALFAMLQRELGDEFFARVETHLRELKFRDGVLISAELGKGNKGAHYVLRKAADKNQSWMERIFAQRAPGYNFQIHPRDESGARALSELQARGTSLVANALAQSTEHILSFFDMLRTELAFYVGCLNLQGQLAQLGEPLSFPVPVAPAERRHSFNGLYDVCLALSMKRKIVGNDANADDKNLLIITGANRGGKSVFLRSIGLAQLMMQCGMFAPAESFSSTLCDGLFPHYKREEDTSMKSGKFDEELSRMSDIVDHITPNSMLLFNESFGATNEMEGSEIARQIVSALLENHVRIFFVTHLYEFACGFFATKMEEVLFLRAERQADGRRTFKLFEGEPLQTSYGKDLYNQIFGTDN